MNFEILAIELDFLTSVDLDFDIGLTGFETTEIDLMIDRPQPSIAPEQPGDTAPSPTEPATTKEGDIHNCQYLTRFPCAANAADAVRTFSDSCRVQARRNNSSMAQADAFRSQEAAEAFYQAKPYSRPGRLPSDSAGIADVNTLAEVAAEHTANPPPSHSQI